MYDEVVGCGFFCEGDFVDLFVLCEWGVGFDFEVVYDVYDFGR